MISISEITDNNNTNTNTNDANHSKMSNIDLQFNNVDMNTIPYPDNTFDCIIVSFGFMFCNSKINVYKECNRVLTQGGKLIFTTWDGLNYNPLPREMDLFLKDIIDKTRTNININDKSEIKNTNSNTNNSTADNTSNTNKNINATADNTNNNDNNNQSIISPMYIPFSMSDMSEIKSDLIAAGFEQNSIILEHNVQHSYWENVILATKAFFYGSSMLNYIQSKGIIADINEYIENLSSRILDCKECIWDLELELELNQNIENMENLDDKIDKIEQNQQNSQYRRDKTTRFSIPMRALVGVATKP